MRLYHTGDKVGTRGATFIQEADIDKPGRYIECLCATEECNNTFIARESYVARDRTAFCNKCRNKSKVKYQYASIGEKIASDDKAPVLLEVFKGNNGREYGVYRCSCSKAFKRERYDTEVNKRWRCSECHRKEKSEKMRKFHVGDFIDKEQNILWEEEIDPSSSGAIRGIFLNVKENKHFQATLQHVLYHDCRYGENSSHREQVIKSILQQLSIVYIKEKTFDGCVSPKGRKLRFDFYLPYLNTVLEIDGEQHYRPVPRFGGEEGYNYLIECDNIKNQYCAENNINLIRIKYDAFLHHEINVDYISDILKIKEVLRYNGDSK